MYMNVIFLEKFLINSILRSNRTDIADASLCRFLHHISKLSGKKQLAFSGHDIDFDLQGITAYLCPCKTAGDPDLILLIGH